MRKSIITLFLLFVTNFIVGQNFASGTGTQTDPYIIKTANHLDNTRKYLGNKDVYFQLANDINIEKYIGDTYPTEGWAPIGYHNVGDTLITTHFWGHFDGAGYKITGLWVNRPESDLVGLFGIINNHATINDLQIIIDEDKAVEGCTSVGGLVGYSVKSNIIGCSVNGSVSGQDQVGGVAGVNDDEGTIKECRFTGVVHSEGAYAGGIVGINDKSSIIYCEASGHITGKNSTGGLAGANLNGFIDKSYATSTVEGQKTAGGLIGLNFNNTPPSSISNSYAIGTVTGTKDIGGLIGHGNGRLLVFNCYASGSVTGEKSRGGLIGKHTDSHSHKSNSTIVSSYFDFETTGQADEIGQCVFSLIQSDEDRKKTTIQMRQRETFKNWDFSNIWDISENKEYPQLRFPK